MTAYAHAVTPAALLCVVITPVLLLRWVGRQLTQRGLASIGRVVACASILWAVFELDTLTLLLLGLKLIELHIVAVPGRRVLLSATVVLTALAPAVAGAVLVVSLEAATQSRIGSRLT